MTRPLATERILRDRLFARGVRLADIARTVGVSRPAVTQVIKGRATSARIRRALERAADLEPGDLTWPRTEELNRRAVAGATRNVRPAVSGRKRSAA